VIRNFVIRNLGLGEGGGAAAAQHGRALPGRRSHHRRHVGGTKEFSLIFSLYFREIMVKQFW
jgi:hypothetical protein